MSREQCAPGPGGELRGHLPPAANRLNGEQLNTRLAVGQDAIIRLDFLVAIEPIAVLDRIAKRFPPSSPHRENEAGSRDGR